jgi:hypothetical protein
MARPASSYRGARRIQARAVSDRSGVPFAQVFADKRLNSTADGKFNPADGYRPRLPNAAERAALLRMQVARAA